MAAAAGIKIFYTSRPTDLPGLPELEAPRLEEIAKQKNISHSVAAGSKSESPRDLLSRKPSMSNRPIDPQVSIGHVHLKVADLEQALRFYCGVLGFAVTQRYGTAAAFISAGGYHHHIGLNTWESLGVADNVCGDRVLRVLPGSSGCYPGLISG